MNEIYQALYSRLSAELAVPIFDHIPQNNKVAPYVRLDDLEADQLETDNKIGFSAVFQVVACSHQKGRKEAVALGEQIYNALHNFDMQDTDSFAISILQQEFQKSLTSSDGKARYSVHRFRIIFSKL